jgi:hypothetical protein
MSKILYEHSDSSIHAYRGIEIALENIQKAFPIQISDKLKDAEGTRQLIETFADSLILTGFKANEELVRIFSLDGQTNEWRIGEAFAEYFLETERGAQFYWNELRDQRNINSNKTGADLVGFVDLDSSTVFLFGEVKTSNDPTAPPNVFYGKTGMVKQLEDLIGDQSKICTLIRYLGIKAMLHNPLHPFRIHYELALKNFTENQSKYLLFGILVRDTDGNEKDLKSRYKNLKSKIDKLPGVELIALYMPIKQSEWGALVNKGR